MAYTLVEAEKLSNTVLQKGVLELFVRDDPILERLGFIDILGNSLTYNVETAESTAQFYSVGDTWVESTGTVTQATAVLKILGGDAEVDNYLLETRTNINDLRQEAISAKVKAVKYEFMEEFYYGNTTLDSKGFNGMHTLVSSGTYNTRAVGSNGTPAVLTMIKLEETIDYLKVNMPQLMVMSKQMRRQTNKYLHGVGGITYMDAGNARIQTLLGVPVAVSDHIRDTENVLHNYHDSVYGYDVDVTTTDDGTSIFVLSFGPQACQGVASRPIQIDEVSKAMETKDASLYRIKWYVGMMLQNILTCTKLTGLDPDGTVTA